jgi:hypothetical protein
MIKTDGRIALTVSDFLIWSFEFVRQSDGLVPWRVLDLKARPLLHPRYGEIRISDFKGDGGSARLFPAAS